MIVKLILYGAGKRCEYLCNILLDLGYKDGIIVVDSNGEKWEKKIGNIMVKAPDIINEYKNASLCITIANPNIANEIRKEVVQKYHYKLEKEISYNKLIVEAYKRSALIRQGISEQIADRNNEDKNILFESTHGLGLGGVEAWTKDICTALLKSGQRDVFIIANKGSYEIPDILNNQMIYMDINYNGSFLKDSLVNLIKLISKRMPCKIVLAYPNIVMLAACVLKYYYPDFIDIIAVIHGGQEQVYDALLNYKEDVDCYVAVSQDIKKGIISKGAEPKKVFSMTCPFRCEHPLTRTYTEDRAKPIHIGYAGRMTGMKLSQKRMDLVLKLIETLEEKRVNYRIEFAGDGEARKDMEDFVHYKYLEKKIQFLGTIERDKLDAFWKRQDICINLADYEGRSISIIEAMGNGAVPVVTATSGVREDIKNDINGYIVPLGDYCSMAARIEYLSQHRERLCEMGRKAHDEVYPKSLMEPHLKLWKKILKIE